MKWIKKGVIFVPDQQLDWMNSHAQVPTVDIGNETEEMPAVMRVYFGTRDIRNQTRTAWMDVRADNPSEIIQFGEKPVLDLGVLGAFDDCGAMPSWIVNSGKARYLFYTGWNTRGSVPFHNSIGLAISEDEGQTFQRVCDGPILDRTSSEPFFCAQPCVLVENDLWRMWYLSCVGWQICDGKPEPRYHIKYAESNDGIHWKREGTIAIDFKSVNEAGIVRSSVLYHYGHYHMWFSYRGLQDYRTDSTQSYRIGYAKSVDGIIWERHDELAGIDVSPSGWDSQMVAYPFVYQSREQTIMLYNGNGFGHTGFGWAVLDSNPKVL